MDSDAIFYELEIVRGRLQSIVDEAGAALLRTAFSNIVREAHDFACAILTPNGHTVVQSQQSIPAFIGTMGWTWRAMQNMYPGFESLAQGDVLATNDPWLGTGQLNDITLIAPVFALDRLVGFAGVVAHHNDIGGRGHIGGAAQVFEEGLRLPILKLVSQGRVDATITEIISWNVRLPNEAMGDLNAMLNGVSVISARLASLVEEVGVDRSLRMEQELEERAEAYMRNVIRQLPDGVYHSSKPSEGGPNAPFSLEMTVTVEADEMVLDLAGSSAEVDEGINSTYSYTYAYSMYGVKCLLAPALPFNDGLFRPLSLKVPEGTVVNCTFPAASSGRSTVGHHLPTLLFIALENVVPEAVIGVCGNPPPTLSLRGVNSDTGAIFATGMGTYGGFGARAHKDGISALSFPTNVQAVSVEMLEIYNPLLFMERELVPDSGGPGTFRGGLGQRLVYKVMTDQADGYARAQWVTTGPGGVRGGHGGGRSSLQINGRKVPRLGRPIPLKRNDVVRVESAGSGGYGPPRRRDRSLVESDVARGYVTAAQATSAYGWNGLSRD